MRLIKLAAVIASLFILPMQMDARDIKDLLKGLSNTSSDSTSTTGGIGALGNIVSGLISKDNIDLKTMVGTWRYSSPAICFKSDNFLQKAGGAAAASAVENKLAPYFRTAGFNNMSLVINEDMTFSMNLRKGALKGTISKNEDKEIIFNFTALGKIKLGSMKAYVTMTGGKSMSIMFDVTKLISIVKAAGSISGNSTIKNVSTLLESYDGICAGFKMSKQ